MQDKESPNEQIMADRLPAVIEVPSACTDTYEVEKAAGMLRLGRVRHAAVYYPASDGFVAQTLRCPNT